jgi:sec-independent protein translocase protein TatC
MTENEPQETEVRMSLGDHLEELRRRLIYALLGVVVGLVAGLVFAKPIILAMEIPYQKAMADLGKPGERLAVLSAGAGFDIYMKTALWCAVIVASPWIIYQIWAFVSAGLLPREKRIVYFTVPFFVVLFLGGAAFFSFFVAVPALKFLLYFDEKVFGVNTVITLGSQVSFMAEMMIVFALAVPMWLLYELGVVLAYFLALKKAPAEAEYQEPEARAKPEAHEEQEELEDVD